MFRSLAWLSLIAALVLATPSAAQVGFDRWGGDYRSFTMRSGDPAQCAATCERDSRCRAWAFSYPATESPNAQCWLKSRVTARLAAPCCVSGVRGAGVIEPQGGPIEFAIDLSAARLSQHRRRLLPEGSHHAAGAAAVLYLGRGALALSPCRRWRSCPARLRARP
jgi:hypothetical protein